MQELSLFTGGGGGILGSHMLGWTPVGYVEWNEYCQRLLKARIGDGLIGEAPIFGDIRTFISEGYAKAYQGMVDVVTAGFPCQPFSNIGQHQGESDERNMWPATADVIRIVKPRFVLLENVPGIRKYMPVVIRDLRRLGYNVLRPLQLGADAVGAQHHRARVWVVAYSDTNRREGRFSSNPQGHRERQIRPIAALCENKLWNEVSESGLARISYGAADKLDRTEAIGNAQVPQCMTKAWELLMEGVS